MSKGKRSDRMRKHPARAARASNTAPALLLTSRAPSAPVSRRSRASVHHQPTRDGTESTVRILLQGEELGPSWPRSSSRGPSNGVG